MCQYNYILPCTRIGDYSPWFIFVVQKMNYLNVSLFVRGIIVMVNLDSTDGSVESIDPKQDFVHRIVRQALDSLVRIFC